MQMNGLFSKWRVVFVLSFTLAALLYIYTSYVKLALREPQPQTTRLPTVERGSIVDRNGKPLAVQTNFYHFGVTPRNMRPSVIQAFAQDVGPVIDMRPAEISSKIIQNKNSSFIYIRKKLTQGEYAELSELLQKEHYDSFSRFDRIPGRIYPEDSLASQLIGYMGDDGKGLSGIEYSQQEVLSPLPTDNFESEIHGDNIYLTIDANLQYRLEKIAQETMERTQAENMMLVASNAKTGEILSYISLPASNLNKYTNATIEETIDRPAMSAYEPGSVFKIFTASACIDTGVLDADTVFLCDGVYERTTNLGETIRITCLDHHGWVGVRGALEYSCNDGFAQMSDLLDTETFLSYVHKFGFGERTGVELPAEATGSVKNPTDKYWSARTKPTMAIGQELSVTALQMIQAASALANGGVIVKPTFIHKITNKDNNDTYVHQVTYGERVLKKTTADYILSCMQTTAEKGTGTRARIGDITIGVKTGTAQMADMVNGGYSDTDFLSNCIAIFPVESPEIILYIVIEKAKGETYAGRIVAPVIAEAADEIIDHMGMTRPTASSVEHSGTISITQNAPIRIKDTVPDFTGRPKRDLIPLLDLAGINFVIQGEGWVVSQNPPAGTPVTEGMTIELTLE